MQDLTKIEKPFSLLDAETQARLKAHPGPIEVLGPEVWEISPVPMWYPHLTYRAAPAPLTKPSINWDHVAPKWVAMATNEDGGSMLYVENPYDYVRSWIGEDFCSAEAFASFVPGACDWRHSLVMRPGCKA